ncbi:MAG: IS630 family transposase [Crenarchaeota archaeon]|nr:IS630 family transposase [Thermoproteota archaeon]
MEKRDFRKLSTEAQYEIKIAALKMINEGQTQTETSRFFGVARKTLYLWLVQQKQNGSKCLVYKKRGRREGEKRHFNVVQEKEIQKLIVDKCPEQLKLPFALWTRKAVQELMQNRFGKKLPIRTIGEYLKRWGYTPQKPLKKAYEQQPKVVKAWLEEKYPDIKERAKAENADIYWGDETGLSSEDNRGRGYSPKGKTPVRFGTGARFSTSMISAIANQGQCRFMIYKGGLKADTFITFLKRLTKDVKRKVFLIVDNLKVHHAIKVKDWLEVNSEQIEIFYLPPYTPEHNPDEYLNQDVKVSLSNKLAPRDQNELTNNLSSYMRGLQRNTKKVRKFFEHKLVKYAA